MGKRSVDFGLKMKQMLHTASHIPCSAGEVSNLGTYISRPAGEVSNLGTYISRPAGEVFNLAFRILICCCYFFFSLNVAAQPLPQFTDITHPAGIDFVHNTGAFGKKYLPETMGSGCAFIDYNTDGWQDILLVNGKDWEGEPTQKRQTMALYRNNGDGTFTDVTEIAGLATPLYGMGVAVADYDNDGDPDIYISTLETDRLFQNNGDGTYADVTEAAGIHNPGFGTSCAWFDYNKDGHLGSLRRELR